MGNGYGSHVSTREADMAAYDRCPAWLRREMQQAVASWAAAPLLKQVAEAEAVHPPQVVRSALRKTLARTEAEDAFRFYGPAHPEADARRRRLKPARNAVNWSARRRK